MAVTKVSNEIGYTALASDIVENKINGVVVVGSRVRILDTGKEYVVGSDMTLVEATNNTQIGLVDLSSDLKIGAKSLQLTLSSSAGNCAIPDTAKIVGVKPVSSTTMRVGLEAPEAIGTATGTAATSAFKKGIPLESATWTWFNLGTGTSRTLYFSGGASDVVIVAHM